MVTLLKGRKVHVQVREYRLINVENRNPADRRCSHASRPFPNFIEIDSACCMQVCEIGKYHDNDPVCLRNSLVMIGVVYIKTICVR